jgi:hypothetical protein
MDKKEIPITFVAFYCVIGRALLNTIRYLAPSYTHHDQRELLRIAFKSAKKFHPNCKCVVLTDQKSYVPQDPLYTVYRYDVDIQFFMWAAMVARSEYLKQHADPDHHVIFMDTDILIQDNLEHVFEADFDVGLTYRNYKDYPINGGLYFIHQKGLKNTEKFFDKLVVKMSKHPIPANLIWWGDQSALKKFIGKKKLSSIPKEILTVDGIRFYFLTSNIYNFSTLLNVPMSEYYPKPKILHFKGERKIYMKPYWENYLKNKSL